MACAFPTHDAPAHRGQLCLRCYRAVLDTVTRKTRPRRGHTRALFEALSDELLLGALRTSRPQTRAGLRWVLRERRNDV